MDNHHPTDPTITLARYSHRFDWCLKAGAEEEHTVATRPHNTGRCLVPVGLRVSQRNEWQGDTCRWRCLDRGQLQ